VDIARLKVEARTARNELRGLSRRQQLFGRIHEIDRLLSPFAPIANPLLRGPWAKPILLRLGIDPRRQFPKLSGPSLRREWKRRFRMQNENIEAASGSRPGDVTEGADRGPVVLFVDTFTRFHEPEIGFAAIRVLEEAGHRVLLPDPSRQACCGRPALSQGMIDVAIQHQRTNLLLLADWATQGIPILVPEPSCASAFKDEMPDLLTAPEDIEAARRVADRVRTIEEHLSTLPMDALPLREAGDAGDRPNARAALLHVHCHQRALESVAPATAALERIPGLRVIEADAGCCGMAGAFGYEAEHYEVSVTMAERKLVSAVNALPEDAWLVASGASCRQQLRDLTGRKALHPVQVIEQHLVSPVGSRR
jgi:Fe-S oxidoreductase